MKLRDPFFISSRLLPTLKIGKGNDEATISLEPTGVRRNQLCWRWYVDFPDGREFTDDDLSGPDSDSPEEYQAMFATLLAFMAACGEGVAYARRSGRESENADLFPEGMREWCDLHSDELTCMQLMLEEGEDGGEPEQFITRDEEDE